MNIFNLPFLYNCSKNETVALSYRKGMPGGVGNGWLGVRRRVRNNIRYLSIKYAKN
jgi:hypothetical protein